MPAMKTQHPLRHVSKAMALRPSSRRPFVAATPPFYPGTLLDSPSSPRPFVSATHLKALSYRADLRRIHNLSPNVRRTFSAGRINPLTRSSRLSSLYTLSRSPSLYPLSRSFSSSPISQHETKGKPEPGTGIKVHVYDSHGNHIKDIEGNEGDDMVDLAWEWDIDIEAACEKSLACSTCHVILEPKIYDQLEEPSDDENDMLDLAFGLTDTSRLGCQIHLTKEMEGMKLTLPSATRNMSVDGHRASH